ncbi:MAG: hypothetical protein PG981_000208 [Wolbachia endosymbiont of Ctenocephalides orientis wCori]|nr:MAG: hypothetical protein PG981_000208 [Wolbachia endosymbiont of Ctenocephalides orientis wCori]
MSQDDQKQPSQKNEIPVQGSKIGGFIKILKDIVKLLFNSVIDMPKHTLQQQEQLKEMQNRQDLDASGKGNKEKLEAEKTALGVSGKSPEDMKPEAKQKTKEAAKGLKEKIVSGASDKPIEVEPPGETPAPGVNSEDSQKSIERS